MTVDARHGTKVFLGPVEVAGVYRGLSAGFAELGVPCAFFDLYDDSRDYGGAVDDPLVRVARWGRRGGGLWRRGVGRAARLARFVELARTTDVFIYGFGTVFTGLLQELAILRRLGKAIIFQFHGSDSRPTYLDGSIMAPDRGLSIDDAVARTKRQARRLDVIGRYATAVIDIPPTGMLHRRPFINWLRIGLPSKPQAVPAEIRAAADVDDAERHGRGGRDAVRVLHAPSHAFAKGTSVVRAIVGALRDKGLPVELVEVHGRPNRDVLRELERCDIVFDQMYADYGMPSLACEGAWYGKPVLLGGHAADEWGAWLPPDLLPPTVFVRPDRVAAELERLVRDRAARIEIGAAARRFVETRWAPREVARRYLQVARGDVPPEWLVEPRDIRCASGVGLDEGARAALLRRYLARGGRGALCLPHNPILADELIRLSGVGGAST